MESAKLLMQRSPIDTAHRRFKLGTILSFIYSVYIAPGSSMQKAAMKLSATTKLLKNGQVVMAGKPEEFTVNNSHGAAGSNRNGAIVLGAKMTTGKYTLQLVVANESGETSETQTLDFEIID